MKDVRIAYLLLLGGGWCGLHRFYLNSPAVGILYLFTFALGGWGILFDLFLIPKLVTVANCEYLLLQRAAGVKPSAKQGSSGSAVLLLCGGGLVCLLCIASCIVGLAMNAGAQRLPRVPTKDEMRAQARAKAEAEAAAINEANKKAHAEEVARRRADYEAKCEQYQQDKADFDEAVKAYNVAKKEREGIQRLRLAIAFREEKNLEVADRRFAAIIKDLPDTQAAKDAKVFLAGGEVPNRETPPAPIKPTPPVMPTLDLPPEPAVVPVVYPIDESDIPDGDYRPTASDDYPNAVRLSNGKTVYVRGYFRSDGKYVAPHTRSAPGGGTGHGHGGGRR